MRNISRILTFFAALSLPKVAQAQQPIRVNCGGSGYTDSKGHVWQSDYGYNWGSVSARNAVISGTTDPALYQKYRYNPNANAGMVYAFDVPNGNYQVNLYFAEIYVPDQAKGKRVFDVKLQGAVAFPKLDIFSEAEPTLPSSRVQTYLFRPDK